MRRDDGNNIHLRYRDWLYLCLQTTVCPFIDYISVNLKKRVQKMTLRRKYEHYSQPEGSGFKSPVRGKVVEDGWMNIRFKEATLFVF